jgi:hypothetical protein
MRAARYRVAISDSAAPATGSTGSSEAGHVSRNKDTWLGGRVGEPPEIAPGGQPQTNRRTRMFSNSPTAMKSAIRALPP